ncbi:aldehyde dehydrogenase (NADP(+)) [Pedobacter sp. N36a]|uniref:aldehyde dehydrogenase (NADP(+)) n=1 Tax=Pedobacter sp. N36a TaxID=2767996 RepID=UPI001656FB7E|nr:aldehyde dehydrogenase (NADP(+)) [Pedobacter sp. N36a]MBC8988119.1 aldehyde dehydrogenase (NADP(+)) [Pedobacter sp. N36a]
MSGATLYAINPASGERLAGTFPKADVQMVEEALTAAEQAFHSYQTIHKNKKALFLHAIADALSANGEEIVNRAMQESGLPLPRLQGELGRTTGQLRLFADLLAEGSWIDAVIDPAIPERSPMPRPDIRKMLVPLGPAVVFGASNFPLAFSVAGGDTASALAAGCPVVVKAHPAHFGTSALVADAILAAAEKTGMPTGIFALLFDDGYEIGKALVQHPLTKAVAFTGSFNGGMALVKLAEARKEPIPVFAEMGSINPVILFPEMLDSKPEELARQLAASITLGAGQFCTNPGIMFAIAGYNLGRFKSALTDAISKTPAATMLSPGIAENYLNRANALLKEKGVFLLAVAEIAAQNQHLKSQSLPRIIAVNGSDFIDNEALQEEVFGPHSILVSCENIQELERALAALSGQLTMTLMATNQDLQTHQNLVSQLKSKTGRIILNGVPTGVEVCAAMQHGGPFPATNDSRFTSVGTDAIYRFVRPLAYQDWPQELLPDALKDGNPLNIYRKINQQLTK